MNRGPVKGPTDGEPYQHAGAEYANVEPDEEGSQCTHYEASERPPACSALLWGGYGDAPLPEQHHSQRAPAHQGESAVEQVGRPSDTGEDAEPYHEAWYCLKHQ